MQVFLPIVAFSLQSDGFRRSVSALGSIPLGAHNLLAHTLFDTPQPHNQISGGSGGNEIFVSGAIL